MLVPFESPASIARATITLLDDDEARQAMRKRAYLYARPMVWKRVAQSHMARSCGLAPIVRNPFPGALPSGLGQEVPNGASRMREQVQNAHSWAILKL